MQRVTCTLMFALVACSDDTREPAIRDEDASTASDASVRRDAADSRAPDAEPARIDGLTLRTDVPPITRADDAKPAVFIPPYVSCSAPREGEPPGRGPDGKVCTNVAISGATEEGRSFVDYASCDIVKTQRPFWSVPPPRASDPNDPRLDDAAYLAELDWVTSQVKASGCVCCHDSEVLGGQAGEWDIRLGPLWLDSLTDTGLALFAGLADSSVLGAYHADENNGFDRTITGLPSTDSARMKAFMLDELARRGISEEQARAVPPFGGPIYANRVAEPTPCATNEGVTREGAMVWNGGDARYVYVMREDSENPGVPPNLDLPEGTLFRLDVRASEEPIASGVAYGTTPAGTFQRYPEATRASALEIGTRYHFYVLRDVGLPLANCVFTFGEDPPPAMVVDAGTVAPEDASMCADEGFGAPCKDDGACTCGANYCALMPGQTTGYCTKTGCKEDTSVCPSGSSCFDLSLFSPGLPSICTQ